jgi:hypothetical protein
VEYPALLQTRTRGYLALLQTRKRGFLALLQTTPPIRAPLLTQEGRKILRSRLLFRAGIGRLNRCVGGAYSSNHLTGCAVDIRCVGVEQAIRYAAILLDIADEWKKEYDELFIERNRHGRYWVHFAVRPKDNRRRVMVVRT